MVIKQGAGINYRNRTLTYDIRACAMECKRPGIIGQHPPQSRRNRFDMPVFWLKFTHIWDLDSHDISLLGGRCR
jgi:hypothetical protein